MRMSRLFLAAGWCAFALAALLAPRPAAAGTYQVQYQLTSGGVNPPLTRSTGTLLSGTMTFRYQAAGPYTVISGTTFTPNLTLLSLSVSGTGNRAALASPRTGGLAASGFGTAFGPRGAGIKLATGPLLSHLLTVQSENGNATGLLGSTAHFYTMLLAISSFGSTAYGSINVQGQEISRIQVAVPEPGVSLSLGVALAALALVAGIRTRRQGLR